MRELASTIWDDGREFLEGTAESRLPASLVDRIPDVLWRESSRSGDVAPAASVPADRLVGVARSAFDADRTGDPLAAAVRAVLLDLGHEVEAPSLLDDQPRIEEQGPSDFEATPVTETPVETEEPADPVDPEDLVAAPGTESLIPTPDVEADDEEVLETETPVKVPAKSGPGSAKSAWLEYAHTRGVDVEPGASRDDIIRDLEDAGIATE